MDGTPVVEVVGLGPAGSEHLTEHTRRVIASTPRRFLRTAVHPGADAVPDAETFDDIYETAASFDDVYSEIVRRLVSAAREHGRVLYAVPGSPLVLERSVALLCAESGIDVILHPASSVLDLAWSRLAVDPVESSVTLVDGHTFAVSAAGRPGPFLVAHCHANWVLSEIKLAAGDDALGHNNDGLPVTILHHLGLPDEQVIETTWSEIDRTIEADHLTSLWIPRLTVPVGSDLVHLVLVDNPPQHPRGDFVLAPADSGGRRAVLPHGDRSVAGTFSGLATYWPAFFADLPPGKRPLKPLLDAGIAAGRIAGSHWAGRWTDVGTPERLAELEARLRDGGS